MKKAKKILAFVLAAAMLLCLTGCGSFESKMVKAVKKMNDLQNFHMDMEVQMGLSMAMLGQSLDVDAKMIFGMDMQNEPMRSRIDMTVEALNTSEQALIYLEQSEDSYTVYASADGGATWEKEQVSAEETPVQSGNMVGNMQMFISCAKSFQEAGTEEINGSAATRYDGEISGESIQTAIDMSGAKDILSENLGTELDEDSFTALGSIPCSLWIDNKSGMIVRYDMDMTAVMQSLLDDMIKEVLASQGLEGVALELTLSKVTVSAVLSQFDQVGEITIPDEAKAA